jgi:hypothetical protein
VVGWSGGDQDRPRSSGRVVEEVVTWPGPVEPSAVVWGGGKVVGWSGGDQDRPRSSGRVVEVAVRWAGPDGTFAFVWGR